MAPLKIELEVSINCSKCKSEVLKAVTKLSGIDHISVDSQKGIVSVIGEVDPVCVATQITKTGKFAKIISVGPPKKPDPPKPKPEPQPEPEPEPLPLPPSCPQCQVISIIYEPYDRVCSIL